MKRLLGAGGLALALLCPCARAQVIEVESNGLKYQTLTRSAVTVMFTHLPGSLHQYGIIQVAVSNGSPGPYVIRPEDFTFQRSDGRAVRAASAKPVVDSLFQKANGNDLERLVTAYEAGIYGNPQLKSTFGYESRRQAAFAASGTKVKSGVLAAVLALVQTKLLPGESTDGAVFFPSDGKPMGNGRLVVRTNTDVFEFNAE
jgi:hypothetical protein